MEKKTVYVSTFWDRPHIVINN